MRLHVLQFILIHFSCILKAQYAVIWQPAFICVFRIRSGRGPVVHELCSMSDILQKTLASLPGFIGASIGGNRSDGNITIGIQTFVQNVILLRSKHVSMSVVILWVSRVITTLIDIIWLVRTKSNQNESYDVIPSAFLVCFSAFSIVSPSDRLTTGASPTVICHWSKKFICLFFNNIFDLTERRTGLKVSK